MDKIYPIDINGIKNIGVEEWLENYYVPVTGKEFCAIYNNVRTEYMSLMKKNQDNVIKWIALSNVKVTKIVSMRLLELLRLSRLKVNGYKVIVGVESEEISDNTSMVHYAFSKYKSPIIKNLAELTFQKMTNDILKTLKYNSKSLFSHGVSFIKNISNPHFFVGNRYAREVVCFCEENNINPVCLSPTLFAGKSKNHYGSNFNTSGLIEFANDFLGIIRKQYTVIDGLAFECLKKEINEIFRLSYLFFCQNVKVFNKFKPKRLLATGLGNPINRLFCSAWRYAGGEVVGLSHGNTYINHYTPEIYTETSIVDVFVTSSRGHKEIVRQAMMDFSPEIENCKITHSKNNTNILLFRKLQSVPPVNRIKKIMVVGNVVASYSRIDAEYHTLALLYHQLEIVKLLKGNGYYVIYKPRPDSSTETKAIFETYVSEVLTDRFEDVYHYADCLLFSAPYSTTFGFSLLTNKPIVLMNAEGYTWYPRAFELIRKRCSVFDAKPVDGKIVFKEQDVLAAVQESINNINYDVLYEFAF